MVTHFWVGSPLDMETRVCLDMETFVQRSNGVFGKSGTGKSFLTRLLLAGILQKTNAVSLIFDMHNDHGWEGRDPERGRTPKGLKQLFPVPRRHLHAGPGQLPLSPRAPGRRGAHPVPGRRTGGRRASGLDAAHHAVGRPGSVPPAALPGRELAAGLPVEG